MTPGSSSGSTSSTTSSSSSSSSGSTSSSSSSGTSGTSSSSSTSGSPDSGGVTYAVGGTIAGLTGTGLILENDAGDDLSVAPNATTFTFATKLASGAAYGVSVKTQPMGPAQTCTVTSGTGVMGSAAVTNVKVTCTAAAYQVCATVSGLTAASLALSNAAGGGAPVEKVNATGNGAICFPTKVPSGTTYNVTATNPATPAQACTVTGGTGTVVGADVKSIVINCVGNTYTLGGGVTGLAGTVVLTRQDGGGAAIEDVTVSSNNATYAFPTPLNDAAAYKIVVKTQPTTPLQTCTVANPNGTVAGANVTNANVSCTTTTFKVSGTITGLTGTGMVLQNNGANDLPITGTGTVPFEFNAPSGQPYAIGVFKSPTAPAQSCVVTNGTGTVTNANVSGVTIACSTSTFSIYVNVPNLTGLGLVVKNNGGSDQTVNPPGPVEATFQAASGQPYAITIGTQPQGQECTVSNGTGTVGSANVTSVSINCVDRFVANFTNGIVLIPASADFNNRTTYTLEGWIEKTGDTGSWMGLLSQDDGTCCTHRMLIDPNNHPYINAGVHADYVFTGTTFAMNQWYHYAMTCSAGVATIWVNGSSAGTLPCADPGDISTDNIYLGAGEGGGPYRLIGKIAEVRISNIVRYSAPFTPQKRFTVDANTMGLYHFDEGTGTTVGDSAKGHNGTFVGNVTWVKDDR